MRRRHLLADRDEGGATLVLALIFVVVVGVVVSVLTGLAGTNLLDTSGLQGQRAIEYAGDSVVDAAIQGIRYVQQGRSSSTCGAPATTGNFPTAGTSITVSEDLSSPAMFVVWTSPSAQCVSVGLTAGAKSLTAPAGTLSVLDVGQAVQGFGVPLGTVIASVKDDQNATLSENATATTTSSVVIVTPPDQRLVIFNACTQASNCAKSPVVRAIVRYNDLANDGKTPDQGLAVTIQNWYVTPANA